MKLAALYSLFDGEELLEGSIRQIRPFVDFVLCAAQETSNRGEQYRGGVETAMNLKAVGLVDEVAIFNPAQLAAGENERSKRAACVQWALQAGYTHFLHMDCDEYYFPQQFAAAKAYVQEHELDGSFAHIKSYFKRPDWEIEGLDYYYVPFIFRLHPDIQCAVPCEVHCDPTRTVDFRAGQILPADMIVMQHYSWVRRDVMLKARNSTAAEIIFQQSGLLEDYQQASVGMLVRHFGRRVRQTANHFGISVGLRPDSGRGSEAGKTK